MTPDPYRPGYSPLAPLPDFQSLQPQQAAPAPADPMAVLMQQLLQPRTGAPVGGSAPPIDFAALLNPPTRHLGLSGQQLNADGSDPGSLFNNPNFHTPQSQGGLYGLLSQSGPESQYLPAPQGQPLAPGASATVPYANGNLQSALGPHVDFGSILSPKKAQGSGIINQGTPMMLDGTPMPQSLYKRHGL